MRIILSCILSLSLVLSGVSVAYADDVYDQEEAVNVIGLSGSELNSESSGESASNDSSFDDLSEDSEEEIDQEEEEEEQGGFVAFSSASTLASGSISLDALVTEFVFFLFNYVLDLGYASLEDWLNSVLGIEVIDYTEELYNLINIDIYGLLIQIRTYIADISTDTDLSYRILVNIYDYLTGHIFNALYDPTYDFTIDGYHSWLELIYDKLDPIHLNVLNGYELLYQYLPYLEDIDTLLSNIGSSSPDFRLSLQFNTSYVYLFGYDSDLVSEWSVYYIDSSSGEHVLMGTSTSESLPFGFPDGYETVIFYGRILDDSGAYDVYYYTPYYFADDATWTFYEIADQGVYGLYSLLADINSALGSGSGTVISYLDTATSRINALIVYADDILEAIKSIDGSGTSSSNVWDFLQSLVETLGDVIVSLVDIIFGGVLDLLSTIIGEFDASEISAQLDTLSVTFSSSFPFGAISVIADSLSALSVDPVAPRIEWELFGESIVLDLSDFNGLATGCRYFLLVLYCIGLFKSTKDWAFGGSD